jgi:hypothetical protein
LAIRTNQFKETELFPIAIKPVMRREGEQSQAPGVGTREATTTLGGAFNLVRRRIADWQLAWLSKTVFITEVDFAGAM